MRAAAALDRGDRAGDPARRRAAQQTPTTIG
jgi:hypothetical protein